MLPILRLARLSASVQVQFAVRPHQEGVLEPILVDDEPTATASTLRGFV